MIHCVNPLNTDDHNGPGGDQFCIFCLRKRGDDALMMVATMLDTLRDVEWAGEWQGEPQCVSCSATARTGTPEDFEASKQPHDAGCRWAITVGKAEALLA